MQMHLLHMEEKRLLEETKNKLSLDDLFDQIQAGNVKELKPCRKGRCTGFCRSSKTESS